MQWLREGLAKLLFTTPQGSFVDAELVVFFDEPLVLRYHKGRVYDKAFDGKLDPVLQTAWDQQKASVFQQADTLTSPYFGRPFAHQYLHVIMVERGLLLLQQTDFTTELPFVPLLVSALNQLLAQETSQRRISRYRTWLQQAGMNESGGRLSADGEFFTPYPAPQFSLDETGCWPYEALKLQLTAPYSVIEVSGKYDVTGLQTIHPTWYRLGERVYCMVSTVDKRIVNRLVKACQTLLPVSYGDTEVHVARSTDSLPIEATLERLRGQTQVYDPPVLMPLLNEVTVAIAATKRFKVRNHQNQWVADLIHPPKMTLECEFAWLSQVLKQPTMRTRYIELSDRFATHVDTAALLKQHKLGGHLTRTALIASDFDEALRRYITEKNAIIGTRNWHQLMTRDVDVFLFDHIAGQADEPLLDYLYHCQMSQGLAVLFPIQQQTDALWLINNNIGLYYMEDAHE
jgi:hypothetical protein